MLTVGSVLEIRELQVAGRRLGEDDAGGDKARKRCGAGGRRRNRAPRFGVRQPLQERLGSKSQGRRRRKLGLLRGKKFVETRGCWMESWSAEPVNETACGRHGHRQHTSSVSSSRRRRPPVTQGRAKPDHSTPDSTTERARVGVGRVCEASSRPCIPAHPTNKGRQRCHPDSSKLQVSTVQSVPGDNSGQRQIPDKTYQTKPTWSPIRKLAALQCGFPGLFLLTNYLESTSGRSESFQGPLRVSGQPARGAADVSLWQPSGLGWLVQHQQTPSSRAPHPFSHPSPLSVQVINPSPGHYVP